MATKLALWLQQQWFKTSRWQLILLPFSWVFTALAATRRAAFRAGLFKSYELDVPVIVVGNISVGGTGKTPLVVYLANTLKAQGLQPGIISRGYGGNSHMPQSVTQKSNAADCGDEPLLLARRTECPIWVGRNRVAVAQALLAAHPACNVLISDDGLQHYRLKRDMEIVVVDSSVGFGNGRLLPAGPLREPLSRLKTVDAVVTNGSRGTGNGYTMQFITKGIFNVRNPALEANIHGLSGDVHAIAGIGNPPRFFRQLQNMGLTFTPHIFADHHAYSAEDLAFLKGKTVIMTEKDAVKCQAFAADNWWYVAIDAQVENTLLASVLNKIGGKPHG